jgi:hypothetical protein
MLFSGAWKLIHEKNLKQNSRDTVLLKEDNGDISKFKRSSVSEQGKQSIQEDPFIKIK